MNEPKKHLPRLNKESYVGCKHVMFDMRTYKSSRIFVRSDTTKLAIELLHYYVKEHECEAICYIFMPDHVHIILQGTTDTADCLTCHNVWKSETAIQISKKLDIDLKRIFQKQSYDHIMRSWEYEKRRLLNKVEYIVMNSVRAGLVEQWKDYPYVGSTLGKYDIKNPLWWEEYF